MASEARLITQPDGFFTNCRYVWNAALFPNRTPIRIDVYINSNRMGGLIGIDQHMNYAARLTAEGKPTPTDFHVELITLPVKLSLALRIIEFVLKKIFFFLHPSKEIEPPQHLPSTLLQNAKENDAVQFRWEGRLFEYRLKQQLHKYSGGKENFQDHFNSLQKYMQNEKALSENPYLFSEDIPSHLPQSNRQVFSENAQLYSLETKTLSRLTPENLKPFDIYLSEGAPSKITLFRDKEQFTLIIDVPGVIPKNLWALADRNRLVILAHSTNQYISRLIPLEQDIDPHSIEAQCVNGVATVTFRLF